MAHVKIIFGNITFDNLVSDNSKVAIVHEIDTVMKFPEEMAEDNGDNLVNFYDGYVIPELFDGKIIYESYMPDSVVTIDNIMQMLDSFCSVAKEDDELSHVELMMCDNELIEFNGVTYYIPNYSSSWNMAGEAVAKFLKRCYKK